MSRYLVASLCILSPILFHLNCKEKPVYKQPEFHCENAKPQVVTFAIVDSIKVVYNIDSSFTHLYTQGEWDATFRGAKASERYIKNTDTITIKWYDNYGKYDDTTGINMLCRDLAYKFDGPFAGPLPLEEVRPKTTDFIGLHGVSSSIRRSGRTIIMYYGFNKAADVLVYLEYRGTQNNPDPENEFFCILESMRIVKSD